MHHNTRAGISQGLCFHSVNIPLFFHNHAQTHMHTHMHTHEIMYTCVRESDERKEEGEKGTREEGRV